MKPIRWLCVLATLLIPALAHAGPADGKLDIYFNDTEGGASTLIVTPTGESVLVDTGNPGERDPKRIYEATKLAGLKKIDHLVITHYHVDHFGGAAELVKMIPFGEIYDNSDLNPSRDRPTPEYLAIPSDKRVVANPGELIPLQQGKGAPISLKFLAARKSVIDPPPGARENEFCKEAHGKAMDLSDNANSIVMLLSFGDFRFYDGGDLTWNIEHDLACPVNRVGTVDVYQVTHHGLAQSNNPVLVKALAPTVAIMNNGPTKGCEPEVFATLKSTPSIQTIFQLHKNLRPDGAENNTTPELTANSEPTAQCKGNYVKLSVSPDGSSYSVSIPATGLEKTYQTRKHD
ncbi:MAG TPA: MBL fold metallo-hydrolase [Tepidisphaeraceae bacterium]|jgi:beta-lactamase superfamily II metal-dependent hydrolase